MLIQQKLEYPPWKIPYFLIKGLLIFIKVIRTGILTPLIENKFFNKQTELILKTLNFIFVNNDHQEIGKKLSNVLINLGPGYIKFGQALSTRPDILGKKTCDELKILQGKLKPFSYSIARKMIQEENENLLQESLASFDENPIASASVAQVHTGILKNGKKVAIKILKPNIHKELFSDFTFFYWISKFIEFCIPSIRRLKLSKNVEILSEVSLNELDLTLEASAADELAENFKDHHNYRVPKIYWEFTTKNMLVLEFIEGIRIDDLKALNASKHNIEKAILIDNTGVYRDKKGLSKHLKSKGVSKVLLTAPTKGELKNIVYGVNHKDITDKDKILGAASCTTNAIVPLLKAISEEYGIDNGHVETVHSYTNDQNLIDNYHDKARRGRSAALNMVLTETGAAKAVSQVLPELEGKLSANAIRVPTPNVSMAILNLYLEKESTVEKLNDFLRKTAFHSIYKDQIDYTNSPEIVSSDIIGSRFGCVVDSQATICNGKNAVIYAWYDNELGYCVQLLRVLKKMAGIKYLRLPLFL